LFAFGVSRVLCNLGGPAAAGIVAAAQRAAQASICPGKMAEGSERGFIIPIGGAEEKGTRWLMSQEVV
jgi:hypothetical protein